MWLRRNALRLIVGLSLIAAIAAMLVGKRVVEDRNFTALAKNVYWEALAANEPELSARMVARVTTTRTKANKSYWGGGSIHGVVYARAKKPDGTVVCQFTWTCLEVAKQEPAAGARWELAKRIAREELAEKFTPPAPLANATFYLNPKYSGRSNICWFKTSLILLGKAEPASQHVFYREPRGAIDRQVLPKKSSVEECNPPKRPQKKQPTTAAR